MQLQLAAIRSDELSESLLVAFPRTIEDGSLCQALPPDGISLGGSHRYAVVDALQTENGSMGLTAARGDGTRARRGVAAPIVRAVGRITLNVCKSAAFCPERLRTPFPLNRGLFYGTALAFASRRSSSRRSKSSTRPASAPDCSQPSRPATD